MNIPKHITRVLLLFLSVCQPTGAAAWAGGPFYSHNLNPFVQIYGLPAPLPAGILPAGQVEAGLHIASANDCVIMRNSHEELHLDGELWRSSLVIRQGLKDRLEWGAEIPYISHGGGVFDWFIEDWHQFFHLPDGGRVETGSGQFGYRYEKTGGFSYEKGNSSAGPGDLTLFGGYQLPRFEGNDYALRLGVKLPVGAEEELHGSGGLDGFVSLSGRDENFFHDGIEIYSRAGLLVCERSGPLAKIQRRVVVFGSFGGGWMVWPGIELKLQLDGNSGFYESDLAGLGNPALLLDMGGTITLGNGLVIDLLVGEDLAVATGPDVVFQVGLTGTFR